jgi:hypothetical protein
MAQPITGVIASMAAKDQSGAQGFAEFRAVQCRALAERCREGICRHAERKKDDGNGIHARER